MKGQYLNLCHILFPTLKPVSQADVPVKSRRAFIFVRCWSCAAEELFTRHNSLKLAAMKRLPLPEYKQNSFLTPWSSAAVFFHYCIITHMFTPSLGTRICFLKIQKDLKLQTSQRHWVWPQNQVFLEFASPQLKPWLWQLFSQIW